MLEWMFTSLTHAVRGTPLAAMLAAFAWGVLSILLSPCHKGAVILKKLCGVLVLLGGLYLIYTAR